MKTRIDRVLQNDFYYVLKELNLNTNQKFEALYYVLFHCLDDPIYGLLNVTKDNFPIFVEPDETLSYLKKLLVKLILSDFTLLSDGNKIQELKALSKVRDEVERKKAAKQG